MNRVTHFTELLNCFHIALRAGPRRGMRTTSLVLSQEQPSHDNTSTESPDAEDVESFATGSAEDAEDELRNSILDAALPFVHSYGWSQDALAQGAESLGYSGMAHGMFPGGGVDLVNHFYTLCNHKLQLSLEEQVKEAQGNPELKKGTTAFIASAVEERLRMNIEYIDSWHRALALHASPLNVQNSLHNLGTLVDHVWYYAGDRTTDFNWYTKRGILAAVYKSTEIYMLQDKSEDFQDSWAFMNRRLSDVHSVGKCAQSSQKFMGIVRDVSVAGLSTALNILGMNGRVR
ncbi:Ubiquinone biosynthesis protein coq9, mitochondrial [Halocaridina rubra]|uniref:Ubiquinone biosynthesis protein n=1 Tax=Halocaridina rubra TaxID=373956 RepID=A0AAN8WR23_HALRR